MRISNKTQSLFAALLLGIHLGTAYVPSSEAQPRQNSKKKIFVHKKSAISFYLPARLYARERKQKNTIEWPDAGGKWKIFIRWHRFVLKRTMREWLEGQGGVIEAVTLPGGIPGIRRTSLFEAVYSESVFFLHRKTKKIIEIGIIIKGIEDWSAYTRKTIQAKYKNERDVFNGAMDTLRFYGGRIPRIAFKVPKESDEPDDFSEFETKYRKLAFKDLTGDGKKELVSVLSVRTDESIGYYNLTYIDVFENISGIFRHMYRVPVEHFEGVRFPDIDKDGVPELVVNGVFGAHGHFLRIVRFVNSWPETLWSEFNPHGILFGFDKEKRAFIKSGIPPRKPNWSYADPHPWKRYTWSGKGFRFQGISEK